jgi:hypothetical protein
MVLNVLDMFLPSPIVKHSGPSTLEVTINNQADENHLVLHLLHYIPIGRSEIDIIDNRHPRVA